MGDNKVVALMLLILGAFLFWLHAQGKLIPLFQQLFGTGSAGLAAKTGSAGAVDTNPGANTLLDTIIKAGVIGINNSPKPVPSGDVGGSSVPVLPGFDPALPGYTQLDAQGNPVK